jgi:hypothetical protein
MTSITRHEIFCNGLVTGAVPGDPGRETLCLKSYVPPEGAARPSSPAALRKLAAADGWTTHRVRIAGRSVVIGDFCPDHKPEGN